MHFKIPTNSTSLTQYWALLLADARRVLIYDTAGKISSKYKGSIQKCNTASDHFDLFLINKLSRLEG